MENAKIRFQVRSIKKRFRESVNFYVYFLTIRLFIQPMHTRKRFLHLIWERAHLFSLMNLFSRLSIEVNNTLGGFNIFSSNKLQNGYILTF
jgi:hypothetical protein